MLLRIMIERKLKRIFKILKGSYYTYASVGKPYGEGYWDKIFYTSGISDEKTIGSKKNIFTSKYHYASVEMHILRQLVNNGITDFHSVLDIGSGAGHWIDFYQSLGAKEIVGIEVSEKCVEYMKEKYRDDPDVHIEVGSFQDYLKKTDSSFDLVNAIGVMFHVVNDDDLVSGLSLIYKHLAPDGTLVISGNFGYWPLSLNTQIREGNINKRLRSRWWWKRKLKRLGFKDIQFQRNFAYLFIDDSTPESHLLSCRK